MKRSKIKALVLLTIIGDIIIFIGSYLLVEVIRYGAIGELQSLNSPVINYIPLAATIMLVLMLSYDMYKNIFYRQKSDIVATIVLIVCMSSSIFIVITFFIKSIVLSEAMIFFPGIIQIITLSLWRLIIWQIRKTGHVKQRILVIGDVDESKEITKKIIIQQGHIFDIRFIYDICAGLEGAFSLMDRVDHVLICANVDKVDCEKISAYCMKRNKNVFLIPSIFSINVNRANLIQVDDVPLFNLARFGLSLEQRIVKRTFDLIVSGVAIILSSPIMLVLVIVIKKTSAGPVFFKQVRVTEKNREFNVLKFRTMVNNAEMLTGPMLATEKDPRITKVGAFLRATRLDELPQFFNVFGGSMSIIGPRPERPFFINKIVEETPEFAYRTAVKGGITGLAQVLGKYTTTFEDKLRYDLVYIKNYSFILDLSIVMKTIKVVLTKGSSAGIKESLSFKEFMLGQNCKVEIYHDYIELQSYDKAQEKLNSTEERVVAS